MIPFQTLGEVKTPDRSRLTLHEHDGECFLKLTSRQHMSTTSNSTELVLEEKACRDVVELAAQRNMEGRLGRSVRVKRARAMSEQKEVRTGTE